MMQQNVIWIFNDVLDTENGTAFLPVFVMFTNLVNL